MRVVIDATGLPWALQYYNRFPFEPSRYAADDMRLAKLEPLKHPTLLDVLRVMSKAASNGENEVMLVAHGNEKGLVMKISPHIQLSAEVSVIKWLPLAVEVFELIDTSPSTAPNQFLLNALVRVTALLDAQADEDTANGMAGQIAQGLLSQANNDISGACALARTGILQRLKLLVSLLKTTENALREVATATDAVRTASFSRIELRACNVGSGPGIAALRSFFTCDRLMAPTVHTFYVQVNAPDNKSSQLEAAAKAAPPGWRFFLSDPQVFPLNQPRFSNPFVRPFFDPPPEDQAVVPGSVYFMLKITKIQTPHYSARRAD